MIRFRCQECGKKLKADDEIIGRKVKCTRCENVEMVPPVDDLAKPKSPKTIQIHQATNTTSTVASSSSSSDDSSDSDLYLLGGDSGSIEMSGDSLLGGESGTVNMSGLTKTGPSIVTSERPRFKTYERKKTDFKRFIPIALIGFAILVIVLIAVNAGWLFNSGPRFNAEFEALPAVANYRRAQNQLEKSRRVMMVMGDALISKKSLSQERIDEFNFFNESIQTLSKNLDTLVEASKMVEQGELDAANKLLTDEAKIMDDQKFDVDRKAEEYNDLTNQS